MTPNDLLIIVVSASAAFFLLILFLATVFLYNMKLKKKTKDIEATNESTTCAKGKKGKPTVVKAAIKKKENVPVICNLAYAYNNTSECLRVPVHHNQAYAAVRCENLGKKKSNAVEVMVPNKAYALHNVLGYNVKLPVYPNEVYAMYNKICHGQPVNMLKK